MRKGTFAGVCSILAFAIIFGLGLLSSEFGIRLPLIDSIHWLVLYVILLPLVAALMSPINRRLLAWRKARGRDVEEEEKYENTTAGIISLRPVDHEGELNSDRRS